MDRRDRWGNSAATVLDQALQAYLIQSEISEAKEERLREFRNMVFAHGVVNGNPDLFYKMFPEDSGTPDEDGVEWIIPESREDVQDMMAELRATGWGGG